MEEEEEDGTSQLRLMSPRRLSRRPLDETRLARRDRRVIVTNGNAEG